VLEEAVSNEVNVGMCCISPIIAARVFGSKFDGKGITMTLGSKGNDFPHQDA
jgi:23S rRNA A1618 N6-methylase RlmF